MSTFPYVHLEVAERQTLRDALVTATATYLSCVKDICESNPAAKALIVRQLNSQIAECSILIAKLDIEP